MKRTLTTLLSLYPASETHCRLEERTHLAISSTEDLPLLDGVPLALLGDEKDRAAPPPAPAAAARLVGVDFGDPARNGEALVLLARVDTAGEPGGVRAVLSLDGDGDGSTDALAAFDADGDAADRFPDRGVDGAGLEAAPRFTGVRRGDAGGFMGDAADAPRDDDDDDVCLAGDGCGAFLAATLARRVAGRVSGDGGAREAPPPAPAAARACLMCLNCRRISAVWDFRFGGKGVEPGTRESGRGGGRRGGGRRGEGGETEVCS